MRLLRQSTSTVISFGPFVDKADGITLKTTLASALDNASTGIMLSKNGGAFAVRHATVTATTYDAHGCYLVTLDATDTNALGRLRVIYEDPTTCLPVWADFTVLTANVYDTLCGSDVFDASLVQILGAALSETSAGYLKAGFVKQYDVASPVFTAASVNQTGDSFAVVKSGGAGDNAAIKAKTDNLPAAPAVEGNVQGHVADALAAYDPPTKVELEAAVSPLALEAGIEAHVLAVLNSYDPPSRAEATADKAAVLAAITALNDITVGEILNGDLSDSLSFPANSLADRLRKLFWILCNRMAIVDATGVFTAYKGDGVTPGATGTIVDNGTNTVRSTPTWP